MYLHIKHQLLLYDIANLKTQVKSHQQRTIFIEVTFIFDCFLTFLYKFFIYLFEIEVAKPCILTVCQSF